MTQVKYPVYRGRAIRGTRLDSCGRVAYGERAMIVSEDCWVSVAVTANYDDGTAVVVTGASGRKCVNLPPEAELTGLSLDITFGLVDPEFYTLGTGLPRVLDAAGRTVGFDVDAEVRPTDIAWALEVWSSAQGDIACSDDGGTPFGYFLYPFLTGGRYSDVTLQQEAASFVMSAALTKQGSQWGFGPYAVTLDADGDPSGLITMVGGKVHSRQFLTLVAPPEEGDGMMPLDDPDNGPATGATAGAPGVWTPAGDVRPANLTALTGGDYDASPSTAWTTGQHVTLGDGSLAHWSGTAWVAGKA